MSRLIEQLARCDARFSRRGHYRLARVLDPARRLSQPLQATLLDAFAGVTDEIYRADTSFHWRSRPDYFDGVHGLWLVFNGDMLCGFTAARHFREAGERILYIDNLNLRPSARPVVGDLTLGGMLVYEMLKEAFPIGGRPMSVVFRTQNPNVYRLGFTVLPEGMAPRLRGASPRDPERSRRVLQAMANRLSPGRPYDPVTSVIKGAYAGCLYGRPVGQAVSPRSGLARFWKEHVDVEAGDAVLIAVCPTHAEVRGLVYRYLRVLAGVAVRRWLPSSARGRAAAPPHVLSRGEEVP